MGDSCAPQLTTTDNGTSVVTYPACLLPIPVPEGMVWTFFISCEADGESTMHTSSEATVVFFCDERDRGFTFLPGYHTILVSASRIEPIVTLVTANTSFGCNKVVPRHLIDMNITLLFSPTEDRCSLVIPGNSVLVINRIEAAEEYHEHVFGCVRIRMGQNFSTLNHRWRPVCEVPSLDTLSYVLRLPSVVLDASSLAVKRVEFTLKHIDEHNEDESLDVIQ